MLILTPVSCAAGQWLSNPQAVMYGVTQTGNVTTVLLALSSPSTPQQPAGTVTNNNSAYPHDSFSCGASLAHAAYAVQSCTPETRFSAKPAHACP